MTAGSVLQNVNCLPGYTKAFASHWRFVRASFGTGRISYGTRHPGVGLFIIQDGLVTITQVTLKTARLSICRKNGPPGDVSGEMSV